MISAYVGWPATGKTQAMVDAVAGFASSSTFLVFDRAREWGAESVRWRATPPSITLCETLSQEIDGPGVYLFRPPIDPLDVVQRAIAIGSCTYVDDEIDTIARAAGWPDNPLRLIAHQGRHLANAEGEIGEMGLLCAMRRPQSCHPDLTAMADHAAIFRCAGKLTLARLHADAWIEAGDEETIRTLPNLTYLAWPERDWRQIRDPWRKRK